MTEISVVVPTHRRPERVGLAVRSALEQTLAPREVIVVVDGPDDATVQALEALGDARVRPVFLPERRGNGAARNAGIAVATTPWVALLDDDDLWLPTKLARQAPRLDERRIVSCSVRVRTDDGELVWPRRPPRPDEPLADYLLAPRGPRSGEALAQTSTLVAARDLFVRRPFREDLARFVDVDWLCRVADVAALEFVAFDEPLVVWNLGEGRERVGRSADWRAARAWARELRDTIGPRAFAGALLTLVSDAARRSGESRTFVPLLFEAVRHGRPTAGGLLAHAGRFALPDRLRQRLAHAWPRTGAPQRPS